MLPPEDDLSDRQPVWDYLQTFWMDTDPGILFPRVVNVCAQSKYSIEELEQIFWNEVEPAVGFNLLSIAGEWAGFDLGWLTSRIVEKNRFGGRLPLKIIRPTAAYWWRKLRLAIIEQRKVSGS